MSDGSLNETGITTYKRELLKYYKTMQNTMKGLRGGKFNMQKMMKKFGM